MMFCGKTDNVVVFLSEATYSRVQFLPLRSHSLHIARDNEVFADMTSSSDEGARARRFLCGRDPTATAAAAGRETPNPFAFLAFPVIVIHFTNPLDDDQQQPRSISLGKAPRSPHVTCRATVLTCVRACLCQTGKRIYVDVTSSLIHPSIPPAPAASNAQQHSCYLSHSVAQHCMSQAVTNSWLRSPPSSPRTKESAKKGSARGGSELFSD